MYTIITYACFQLGESPTAPRGGGFLEGATFGVLHDSAHPKTPNTTTHKYGNPYDPNIKTTHTS